MLLIGTQEIRVSNFEKNLSNSLHFNHSQKTPIIQSKSDNMYSLKSHHHNEFGDINAKIVALKAFFIDEVYTIRQDLSTMQEKYHQIIM